MAVPKRKMSRSNTRSRRSQWKAQLTELQTVRVQGRDVRIPRRLVKAYKAGLISDRSEIFAGKDPGLRGLPLCLLFQCSADPPPAPGHGLARAFVAPLGWRTAFHRRLRRR